MTVIVDDMYRYAVGQFGRMKMSHMLADSTDELLAMARRIGVDPKWIRHAGENGEHIDIAPASVHRGGRRCRRSHAPAVRHDERSPARDRDAWYACGCAGLVRGTCYRQAHKRERLR
ncbi:DUF4031 domain-containing protein [Burkholderia plantarii]|uniref:DUF4031 domain-containing protein n=1 Tax=Burkholderia plantarii TaxID=41899 RepID=UPI00272BCAEE|nr:DUF4031 domain-containing protein [Burkholderia plantarii]